MNKKTALGYLILAFLAFAGLGVEGFLAFFIEPLFYGAQIQDWSTLQNVIHWIITCIIWGVVAFSLLLNAKKKYDFELFIQSEKLKLWQWMAILAIIFFTLIVSYFDWNGFKVIKEFAFNGWLKFIFQYIYYIFETVLVSLILIFGQKACEICFRNPNIPYGGIIAAITWGLAHILTKGDIITGIICAVSAFFFGSVYLLTNRNIKIALPIFFIMFIL